MAKYLNETGLQRALVGLWARITQLSRELPPGTLTRRFLEEDGGSGEGDFTLHIEDQREWSDEEYRNIDGILVAFEMHEDVGPLDEFLAYFKLDYSTDEWDDNAQDYVRKERAVYISCEFSRHKPNAQLKLHPYNMWILNELGLDGIFSGSINDWGDLLLLILLVGALDTASMVEHPIQGHWEDNTFFFYLKDMAYILNDLGNASFLEGFSGGVITALAMTLLMELVQYAEYQYLIKTEVLPE